MTNNNKNNINNNDKNKGKNINNNVRMNNNMNNSYMFPSQYMGMNLYPYMFQQKTQMMPYPNYYMYPQNQSGIPKPVFMPMCYPMNMSNQINNNNLGNLKPQQQQKEKPK